MSSSSKSTSETSTPVCRRKGERSPLPVEVKILVAERAISGIVRDVTMDTKGGGHAIGISLMHFEPLSVDSEYVCQTVTQVKQLPGEFKVQVRWCRYFEDEAFVSGGIIQ
ncbi:PilZ domain-containing protein [Thalassoglobus polymorphus]|uniref:PilZ domain-containing protein n=1 Tax=Thalassoglobus polymorphus TaxID=2527994 RepID=A0A517QP25_9PLAN|nr:PilZ domain-containing protein [Thalassoglobus polymorphus]QDT33376.1 hypothetical protein Mal48_26290 [Thalassoglobus polymorphus]